jgi:Mrp family chromosome partitioning ATPase
VVLAAAAQPDSDAGEARLPSLHAPVTVESLRPAPVTAQPSVVNPVSPSVVNPPKPTAARTVELATLKIDEHLAQLTGNSLAAERCKTVAIRIAGLATARRLRTIVFTSADPGEGKTTMATSIALAIARVSTDRILLIDASSRASSVGSKLGLKSPITWPALLDGFAKVEDGLVCLTPGNLTVLVIGSDDVQTSGLRHPRFPGGRKAEELFKRMADEFDLVLIDAPALLESEDARWLSEVSDGTVLIARRGVTDGRRLTAARKVVPKSKRLGIVLNDVPEKSAAMRDLNGRPRRGAKSQGIGR